LSPALIPALVTHPAKPGRPERAVVVSKSFVDEPAVSPNPNLSLYGKAEKVVIKIETKGLWIYVEEFYFTQQSDLNGMQIKLVDSSDCIP